MSAEAPETASSAFPGGLREFLIRAVAGSSAVHLLGMGFTFLVGVQLARGLGVVGYGQYGIAMAAIALASIPGEFGLPRLVTREVAAASAKRDDPRLYGVLRWADRTALLLSLSAAALLAVGGFVATREDASTIAGAILVGAAVIPLVALLKIRGAALQGLTFVVRGQLPSELLRPLLFSLLLLVLFAAVPAAGAVEAVALNLVTALAALAVAFAWLAPRLPRPKPTETTHDGRRWLASAFRIALFDGLRVTYVQLAILLLGALSSVAAVGLFRIAISIAVVIALPVTLINNVAAPVIARLWADEDRLRLQQLCTHAARWMTLGGVAFTLPFLLWGSELIALVFGREFAAAETALLVLAASHVASAFFGPNVALLTMAGQERRVARAMAFGLLFGLALALLLIPQWAETGAAVAVFGAVLVWNVATWLDARRLLGIETSILVASRR